MPRADKSSRLDRVVPISIAVLAFMAVVVGVVVPFILYKLEQQTLSQVSLSPTGMTATPQSLSTQVVARFVPIRLLLPGGSTQTIDVQEMLGDINRLKAINETEPVSVDVPPNWRWSLPSNLPQNWQSYQLPEGGQAPCPGWTNRYNTASIQFSLSNVALVFAEKGEPYSSRLLVPIDGVDQIPVLDSIMSEGLPDGAGPLHASIQLFLVPEGTRGTITVFDRNNFTGNSCQFTLP